MSKDYAQRSNSPRQVASGTLPGWAWLVIGVAIGFAAAAIYAVTRPPVDAAAVVATATEEAKPNGKKKITIPPKEPSRFAFYELLPSYEVVIPRESVKSPARAAGDGGERFVIQVGSFKERKEADQQKANLALLGIESRVEKVTIDNNQTWYRVRIGPERDRAHVESIMARLEEHKVSALVMQLPP